MLCPGSLRHSLPQAGRIARAFSNEEVEVIGGHRQFRSQRCGQQVEQGAVLATDADQAAIVKIMKLTFVHPAVGHRAGESYVRTWQMESLPIAVLAGLTPPDIETAFYDDRMEAIDYDAPTDAVAIPIETYTAARAYQIASEYRRRGVPVVMGGFHATLVPDEVARYAEAVVTGEAEGVWARVIDDLRHGTLQRRYHGAAAAAVGDARSTAGSFAANAICRSGSSRRDAAAISRASSARSRRFSRAHTAAATRGRRHRRDCRVCKNDKRVFFFVDDNFAGDLKSGKPLLAELAKLDVRWITQMSIDAAHDEEFLDRAAPRRLPRRADRIREPRRGESEVDEQALQYDEAAASAARWRICAGTASSSMARSSSATSTTRTQSFDEAVDFATEEGMYIAAFNHLTPFPGTPLYKRLQSEGRLRFEAWWLDPEYRYNALPFMPKTLTPDEVTAGCVDARRRFYGWPNIVRRSTRHMHDALRLPQFLSRQCHASQRDLAAQRLSARRRDVARANCWRCSDDPFAAGDGGRRRRCSARMLRGERRCRRWVGDDAWSASRRSSPAQDLFGRDWAVIAEEDGDVIGDVHGGGDAGARRWHSRRASATSADCASIREHRRRIRYLREGYASIRRLAPARERAVVVHRRRRGK